LDPSESKRGEVNSTSTAGALSIRQEMDIDETVIGFSGPDSMIEVPGSLDRGTGPAAEHRAEFGAGGAVDATAQFASEEKPGFSEEAGLLSAKRRAGSEKSME